MLVTEANRKEKGLQKTNLCFVKRWGRPLCVSVDYSVTQWMWVVPTGMADFLRSLGSPPLVPAFSLFTDGANEVQKSRGITSGEAASGRAWVGMTRHALTVCSVGPCM